MVKNNFNNNLRSISALLLLAVLLVFFSHCQKEYSYEGGPVNNGSSGGTAVYILSGAGGSCTGSIISGNYYAGLALNNTNTVVLEVNVTTVGTYLLTTNTADGVNFSSSGTFTSTGIQSITLTGNGSPTAAGTFIFVPPVGVGCSFKIPVTIAPPLIASFTFSGAPNGCSSTIVNGNYINGVALTNTNTVTVSVNVTAVGNYTITTDTLDGISFSATGYFNNTGNQTVTLNGNGTPLAPQNIAFTLSGATTSCTFIAVVRNPDPLGVYVLESNFGSPNPCNAYVVNGIYTAHTALNNTNNVTVKVTVTTIGNFTISTNTVNGISFSYTGVFTTIGTQYVILNGTGTPIAAGTFSFTPQIVGPAPIGGSACALNITVL